MAAVCKIGGVLHKLHKRQNSSKAAKRPGRAETHTSESGIPCSASVFLPPVHSEWWQQPVERDTALSGGKVGVDTIDAVTSLISSMPIKGMALPCLWSRHSPGPYGWIWSSQPNLDLPTGRSPQRSGTI